MTPLLNASPTALIVDDQPENLDVLVNYLSSSGMELMVATDGKQALELAYEQRPDIVLLDVMMPGMDGFEVCQRLKAKPETHNAVIIFLSALTDVDSKLKGFKAGAIDFINKPLQREEVLARINAHLTIQHQQAELHEKNRQLEALNKELQDQINLREKAESALNVADEKLSMISRQEAERWGLEAFIGRSAAIRDLIQEVTSLQQAPSTNVLVLGESGTGKELISRAIHFGSKRNSRPFVAVNCAAIPMELADAEFFGHVKGAFTGAASDRSGYFAQADGGTLFLDEIGDMPLSLQAKLLRVLEDGWVTPIGGKRGIQVDVRIVAATNVDLQHKVQANLFRQDLFYRLASYQISLPPLRERRSDISALVEHFLGQLGRQMGRDHTHISSDALEALCAYTFPGNVRELKNILEYSLIASRGEAIEPRHLRMQGSSIPNIAANSFIPPTVADSFNALSTQEDAVIQHTREHGRIDNTEAQALLNVDHGRASYLLKKLHKEGRLIKQGQRRWTWYSAT